MNNMVKGSIWKCIDADSNHFNKYCVIKYVSTNPEYNGCGDIELLYSDKTKYFGKVRRFTPGATHIFIKHAKKRKE